MMPLNVCDIGIPKYQNFSVKLRKTRLLDQCYCFLRIGYEKLSINSFMIIYKI